MKKIKTKKDYESYRKALFEHIEELLEETYAYLHLISEANTVEWARYIAQEAIKKFPFKLPKEDPNPIPIYWDIAHTDPLTGQTLLTRFYLTPEDEESS